MTTSRDFRCLPSWFLDPRPCEREAAGRPDPAEMSSHGGRGTAASRTESAEHPVTPRGKWDQLRCVP